MGIGSTALVVAVGVRADEPMAAETLFDRGVEAMKKGDFAAGCPLVAESQRLEPRPGTLFTLAECWAGAGHTATALARYHEYLRVFERMSAAERAGQRGRDGVASQRVRELEEVVPRVTIRVPDGWPEDLVVRRNGNVVGRASFGLKVPTDPGEQVIEVVAPDGATKRITLTLAPGSDETIVLRPPERRQEPAPVETPVASPDPAPPPPLPDPPPPSVPPDEGMSGVAIAGWSAVGLAGAGLLTGVVAGGVALSRRGAIDRECGLGGDPTLCTSAGVDLTQSTRSIAHVSTAGFVVAGVAAAVGITLLLLDPSETGDVAWGPDSEGVVLRF